MSKVTTKVLGVLKPISEAAKSVEVIVGSVLAIISALGLATALNFGGRVQVLERAIQLEGEAEGIVAAARQSLSLEITDGICKDFPEECTTLAKRNFVESFADTAVRTSTAIEVESALNKSTDLSQIGNPDAPTTETNLSLAISDALRRQLGPMFDDRVVTASSAFGGEHLYARKVNALILARGNRRFLEGNPNLVEAPKWWRDPLLVGSALFLGIATTLFVLHFNPRVEFHVAENPSSGSSVGADR